MELSVIQSKIYEIRGLQSDAGLWYQVETRALNQTVKRNMKRFPENFMFQLTKDEWENLKSQLVTSSWGGTRKLPFAFSEGGVAMLSGVLHSNIAIVVNINIMRAFIAIRQLALNPPVDRVAELQHEMDKLKAYIEEAFTDYNDINEDTRIQLELINQALAELQTQKRIEHKPRRPIGYIQP
jgi:hypothetical protein